MGIRSLRQRIIILFVALLAVIQAIALLLVTSTSGQIARDTSSDALLRGERIFQRLLQQNLAQLAQGAAILSADFAFREAIATNDTGTIVSVLRNHGARASADAMLLVALDGTVRADTTNPERIGRPFAFPQLTAAAARDGKASAIVVLDGKLYQMVIVPVLAPEPIAWVGLGFLVDDAAARELKQLAALDVTFASRMTAAPGWTVHASTLADPLKSELHDDWLRGAVLSGLLSGGSGNAPVHEVNLGGERYETRVTELSHDAALPIIAVLQRPLAEGLQPFQRLNSAFFWLAAASMLLTILGSVFIARNITRPINRLAAAADRIQQGDYDAPVDVGQKDEIGALAASFDHMRQGIASREKEILRLAYVDGLTGLANRAMFQERLSQAVKVARRGGPAPSVMLLDLDRFKAINDTLGHPVGDLALKEIGRRLVGVLRVSDSVARLGGDEFAILLPTDDGDHAAMVARKILRELEQPIIIEDQPMDLGASIGIAHFPVHGEDESALMRSADIAMYAAKHDKTGFTIFDPRLAAHRETHLTLLGELRRAVEEDELELYYQPKLSIGEGRMAAAEALVRWKHPERGMVSPAEFIPFAEQTGYIGAITRWVIDAALRQCGEWHRAGLALRISINASARDLREREDLPRVLADAMRRHQVAPGQVCLEITESALMEDPQAAQATLRRLQELGVTLSIDDYGIGHSSLAYLKQLAVNELKIDQAFVTGMEADRQNLAIVRSTIELGHNLGLTVVAEGVETAHELDQLTRLGCDSAQGYWIGRPMPASALPEWIAQYRAVQAR